LRVEEPLTGFQGVLLGVPDILGKSAQLTDAAAGA
jgi:hypothetical protein